MNIEIKKTVRFLIYILFLILTISVLFANVEKYKVPPLLDQEALPGFYVSGPAEGYKLQLSSMKRDAETNRFPWKEDLKRIKTPIIEIIKEGWCSINPKLIHKRQWEDQIKEKTNREPLSYMGLS